MSKWLVVWAALLAPAAHAAPYSGGSGTGFDPYRISTVQDWQRFAAGWLDREVYFILTADLDLDGVSVAPIGEAGDPFGGVFDGQGHTIRNVHISRPDSDYVGVFGYMRSGAQIKRLGVADANIVGRDYVGGLVGYNQGGTAIACYATGEVRGRQFVGGLVGYEHVSHRTIKFCYAAVSVTGVRYVGGLVGVCSGHVVDCYAEGPVNGEQYVGGLVGYNDASKVIRCYSTGTPTGLASAGGLCGHAATGWEYEDTGNFWDTQTSQTPVSAMGMGKTTVEMKDRATFVQAGWDILNVWSIDDGMDYPRLNWPTYGGGGSGTQEDPYKIATPDDWLELSAKPWNWDKHFILVADVDLGGVVPAPVGNRLTGFTGTFDGQGHTINNAVIDRPSGDYTGLFGYVGPAGRIENLHVVDVNVQGGERVGGLVGHNEGGAITACSVTGTVGALGRYVGGLTGYNDSGPITLCHTTTAVVARAGYAGGLTGYNKLGAIAFCRAAGTVSIWADGLGDYVGGVPGYTWADGSGDYVGGLAGYNDSGTITSCSATTDVIAIRYVGGLAGYNKAGTLTFCRASGDIRGVNDYAGGLVGYNESGWVESCYATGNVIGYRYVGGLAGDNYRAWQGAAPLAGLMSPGPWGEGGEIISCYAKGTVRGVQYVGGLVGANGSGVISFCYSTAPVVGSVGNVGGLVGYAGYDGPVSSCLWDTQASGLKSSYGGTGKTTAQMKSLATFTAAGWDFEETWAIVEGNTYPRLQWQSGGTYSGGSGTQADPFIIRAIADWRELTVTPDDWDAFFVLLSPLEVAGGSLEPIGNVTTAFTGVFDGRGHTISNARIGRPDSDCVGLFGIVGFGGRIENLGVVNADVQGRICSGVLAGLNCEGTIRSCYTTGSVGGSLFVGGLVGYNWEGAITACHSTAATNGVLYVGGLAGRNSGSISFCYAAGLVNGNDCVGGLVGYTDAAPVAGSVESSFWDVEASGQASGAGGTGKTTAEMKMPSTFTDAGWDFIGTWGMRKGNSYPELRFQPWGTYSGGSGTHTQPYIIDAPVDWQNLMMTAWDWNKFFVLTSDLDLSGLALTPVGHATIGFTGVLDGRGHRIRNAVINGTSDRDQTGLFGRVGLMGRIANLGVVDVNVQGHSLVGGLVGVNSGTIDSCYVTGSVAGTGESVGGLAGSNSRVITSCHVIGTVTGANSVGGLVGYAGGAIASCHATGTVTGTTAVGGLVGAGGAAIMSCQAANSVRGTTSVGGLIGGLSSGTITLCCASGTVDGYASVGGLIGSVSHSVIDSCYATAASSGVYQVGGLAGGSRFTKVRYCYSAGPVLGTSSVGGLCGSSTLWYPDDEDRRNYWDVEVSGTTVSAVGVGKTTAQMKTQSAIVGFNFRDTWAICEGTNYPRLQWQIPAADFLCPDGVSFEDMAYFAGRWLMEDCSDTGDCDGADLTGDGKVDMGDLVVLGQDWGRQE